MLQFTPNRRAISGAISFTTNPLYRLLPVVVGPEADFDRLWTIQTVTTAGAITIADSTTLLLINKAVLSDTTLLLPSVSSRDSLPLLIADYSGNGGTITLTPGSENINGQATWSLVSTGAGYGAATWLWPVTSLSGWIVATG